MRESIKIVWAIFVRDLKRLLHNPVAIIVTLGICFLPSLYAWYCIAANWDPYANTSALKVAVANNDEGATSEETGYLDVGVEVVSKLHDNDKLGWQFVDEAQAIDGVRSGEYYAAIVIPKSFSSDFTSVFTGDFTNPQLDYYVNEKLSSVTPKITDQGATTIESTIDEQFISSVSEVVVEISQKLGNEAINAEVKAESSLTADVARASDVIAQTRANIAAILPQIESAKQVTQTMQSGMESAKGKADALADELDNARSVLADVRDQVTQFDTAASDAFADVSQSVLSGAISGATSGAESGATSGAGALGESIASETVRTQLAKAIEDIHSAVNETQQSLDDISTALASLEGTAQAAGPLLSQVDSLTLQLRDVLAVTQTALTGTDSALENIQHNIDNALTDLRALQNAQAARDLATYLDVDPKDVGNFMAAPVTLQTHVVYPVSNYGSGVAPFYTNLALWVAGFVLMAVVRMRVDPEGLPEFTARQAYFGRWLFYILVGLIQATIVCVGDLLIGVQCESPAAFIGAGLLAEFVYVNLLYALARAFRHIGKAIGVLLLIMQIPGSSGMYPVEMMPAFFQAIHPLLPFTYAIDAMREAIGGFYELHYLWDMLTLGLIFIPIGFFIGLFIGRRAYNLNLLFDDKLSKTDLFVAEDDPAAQQESGKFRLRPVLAALLDTKEYRSRLLSRAEWFQRNYGRLTRVGWIAVVAQPIITLALMFVIRADVTMKLILLCAMVVGIIFVDIYMIVIAYMNANIRNQLAAIEEDAQ